MKTGEVYKVTHVQKGTFKCRILHVGKIAIYATITDLGTLWMDIKVGDEVRLTRRLVKFKKET
jgi:hypothetical protein